MAGGRELPPPIREVVEQHGLTVWELPIVNWPDEHVLRRREILGGVGIYTGVIAERDGRIAIVRNAGKDSVGGWSIPGGRVEPGESLAAAVVREAKEESGLDVVVTRPLAVGVTAVVGPTAGHVDSWDVTFEARVIDGSLSPGDLNEILEARWASRHDIEGLLAEHGLENAHPFDLQMWRCVREFFHTRPAP